ncbi:hypothetical protein OOK27_15135 [Streptomyces canus]|nr:hypothetical protein [Streptomyces canus]MCX5255457.1 hypothetical protein [Streptomyces canus]
MEATARRTYALTVTEADASDLAEGTRRHRRRHPAGRRGSP